MKSKAQAFMPDFLGSLVVFAVMISLFLFAWNSVQSNSGQFDYEKDLRRNALYTTTFMVSTAGYPEHWNSSNVTIPGFATSSDNLLSSEKLKEFGELSYDEQLALMGVTDFYLVLENSSGVVQVDSTKLEYGSKPSDASTVVPVTRNVLVNGSSGQFDAEMRYVVWN